MSDLLTMSPAEFCEATKACAEGREWALTQPTMAELWDNCPRADWLLWISNKLGQSPDDRTLRLFAVWCARNTPLGDGRKTGDLLTDPRSLAALEVAERFAHGKASQEKLVSVRDAAGAAARNAAGDAARNAARAAWATAGDAAWATAGDAAWATAGDAAWNAARAAWDAAWDEARYAAWAAARDAQADQLRTLVPNPFTKEAQP